MTSRMRHPWLARAWSLVACRWRDEQGLTIVEGVVASLLVVLGSLAALQVFEAGTRNTYRTEQSQVVNDRLQAELEEIRSLPYARVAMKFSPGTSSDPADPRSRVSGSSFAVTPGGTALPMVISSAGGVDPGPDAASDRFESGDVSGRIYRFVVLSNSHLKQVIVAAKLDATATGERAYQEIHTEIADPDATPDLNPAPPGDDDDNDSAPEQLWITDTTCDNSSRQPLTGHHAAHNTRGDCSDGLKTGAGNPGAPDLMFTKVPAVDPSYPDDQQPLYNYATDVNSSPEGRGLRVKPPTSPGCIATLLNDLIDLPLAEQERHHKLHKWVTPPVPSGGAAVDLGTIVADNVEQGTATLELRTQTTSGSPGPGRVCVYLFKRVRSELGLPRDIPFINATVPAKDACSGGDITAEVIYFPCTRESWPGTWTEVSIPMKYVAASGETLSLAPGERLGLAISVEAAATASADGLEFMYDHPSFDSRLEIAVDGDFPF